MGNFFVSPPDPEYIKAKESFELAKPKYEKPYYSKRSQREDTRARALVSVLDVLLTASFILHFVGYAIHPPPTASSSSPSAFEIKFKVPRIKRDVGCNLSVPPPPPAWLPPEKERSPRKRERYSELSLIDWLAGPPSFDDKGPTDEELMSANVIMLCFFGSMPLLSAISLFVSTLPCIGNEWRYELCLYWMVGNAVTIIIAFDSYFAVWALDVVSLRVEFLLPTVTFVIFRVIFGKLLWSQLDRLDPNDYSDIEGIKEWLDNIV